MVWVKEITFDTSNVVEFDQRGEGREGPGLEQVLFNLGDVR